MHALVITELAGVGDSDHPGLVPLAPGRECTLGGRAGVHREVFPGCAQGAEHCGRRRMKSVGDVIDGWVPDTIRVVSGEDRELAEALYLRYARAVHLYALRRINADAAQDVTAETFLVAWRRRASMPADPLPWLYAIARRVLANQRRSATRQRRWSTAWRSSHSQSNAPPTVASPRH